MLNKRAQYKRTGMRLEVNEGYAESQRLKIEARGAYEIKEVRDTQALTVVVEAKVREILEFNSVVVSEAVVREVVAKYVYTPVCDIKSHEIIKAYYQIENLAKYLTHQAKV